MAHIVQGDQINTAMVALCSFLGGTTVALCAAWATHVRNSIGRAELAASLDPKTSPYMQRVYDKLEAIHEELKGMRGALDGMGMRLSDAERDIMNLKHTANGEAKHRSHHAGGS